MPTNKTDPAGVSSSYRVLRTRRVCSMSDSRKVTPRREASGSSRLTPQCPENCQYHRVPEGARSRFGPVLARPVTRWTGEPVPESQVLNVHFSGRPGSKLVEDRACSYCWATFTQTRTSQYHCSPACSKRDSAWNAWVTTTRREARYGRSGPALPPAGATLAAAIAPFEQVQLFEVAG